MGERKVLNKYFPPDFDPSLVPRRKRPKNLQIEVRMMLPFSLQCATCGEYMYRGKKFNSRKEDVVEENYHGIRIFRFYIKCITCSSEITFKTDPKHGDYVAEHGCMRNFEPWREKDAEEEAATQQREEEEKGDAMKVLENRTLDSKREMDILDALDEIKAINQRHAKVDTDLLLQQHAQLNKQETTEEEKQRQLDEDRQLAKQAFEQKQSKKTTNSLKRSAEEMATDTNGALHSRNDGQQQKPQPTITTSLPTITVKKKATGGSKTTTTGASKKKKKAKKPVVMTLVAQYSDSSEEDAT